MEEYFNENNLSYITYDSMTALRNVEQYIDDLDDFTVKMTCKYISDFSMDFSSDLLAWAKHLNGDTFENIGGVLNDPRTMRTVLKLSGNGYLRMAVMVSKAVKNMTAAYYLMDLPESSLHIVLARNLLAFMMKIMPYTKFVITTHSPDIIDSRWKKENIIEL